MRKLRQIGANQNGSVMLEMALVAPILIFILAAIAQFAYGFYVYASLQSAARSATREYSLNENFQTTSFLPCADITTPASGGRYAEKAACEYLDGFTIAGYPDFVLVRTEVENQADGKPDVMKVYLQVPLNYIIFINIVGLTNSSGSITAFSEIERQSDAL